MRLINLKTLGFLVLFAVMPALVLADQVSIGEAGKHLPDTLGDFRATSPVTLSDLVPSASFAVRSPARRTYTSKKGEIVSVNLVVTISESSAYAVLTKRGCAGERAAGTTSLPELGTKQCVHPTKILFARGPVYVEIENEKASPSNSEALASFARTIAPTLDAGEGDFPVLVKHLPGWPNIQDQIFYAVTPEALTEAVANQPLLNEITFVGGAEAVVANYGTQRLLLVEFNTASLATDNDGRIKAKLQELRNQGQAVPSAYRRVGNYAVFVFDAPDEQTASQLIDQVKYQQVVQWLGENPYSYEQATREFTETTLGVFVSVVKASGLALVATLVVGGFFGTLLFRVRRSQQRAREAYADSDAMLRLNLDDLTPESDPARLLGRGN